jgi:hypothetical protein
MSVGGFNPFLLIGRRIDFLSTSSHKVQSNANPTQDSPGGWRIGRK